MKSWIVRELGGIEALSLCDVPEPPRPGPEEALMRVRAVALNYPDLLMLSGGYQYKPPLPFVPGMEGVGEVLAVGESGDPGLIGQRMIMGSRAGLLAEQVVCPLAAMRPVPEGMSDAEAAGFTVGAKTAWVGLVTRGQLAAGEELLVLGATGGMGLMAVAMGKALGARVTAATSSAAKVSVLEQAGADDVLVLDRSDPDLSAVKGCMDVVFDPVGGPLVRPAISSLRWRGRYLVIGFVGGPPVAVPTNLALLKGIDIVGVRAGEYGRRDPESEVRHLEAIDALAASGKLPPMVHREGGMTDVPELFRAMAKGELVGKAVVHVGAEGG